MRAMTGSVLIVDALSAGRGKRTASRDSIGCGPRAIAGVFEKHDLRCSISRIEDVLDGRGKTRSADHLAVSAMSMDTASVKQLLALWRRKHSSGRVLLGGPIASDASRLLKELRPDVVIIGEGEETLDELIVSDYLDEQVDLSQIAGLGYLSGGEVVLAPPRHLMPAKRLWEHYLPSTLRILDYPAYQASKIYVETIRGCSNYRRTSLRLPDGRVCSDCGNCSSDTPEIRMDCPEDIQPGCGFCSVPAVWGPPRSRDAASIVEEISALLDLGVHRIVLEAPDFLDYMRGDYPMTSPCEPLPNLDAISALLSQITELPLVSSGEAHLAIENMKACLFTEEVAVVLKSVLKTVSPNIGLETGSESHSHQIGKCGTPQDVARAVALAKHYGMSPFVYFIYGLPGETEKTVDESIIAMRDVANAGAERIILYGFRPLPNSAFSDFDAPNPGDSLSRRLRAEARRINRVRKDNYLGKVIRGIAAEPSWERHGYTMVYPLGEGPLMTIEGGFSSGTVLDIEITSVLSSGLLGGIVAKSSK
jgi:radical SAM superfamily enzyme YgiQ (UPF0313 family)